MIIGIDWNNTIQDMIDWICKLSNSKLVHSDFAYWDIPLHDKMGMSKEEFLNFAWKNEDIQMNALPFPGAKEAIDKLAKHHAIKIITSSFMHITDIADWFDKHQIYYDEIVRAKDKSEVRFNLLIDDNPQVLQQMINLGKPVLKFTLPWNSEIDCLGFSDWRTLQ